MALVERSIQRTRAGKWDEFMAWERKFEPIHKRLGVPPKRHYQCIWGEHDLNTHIWEIEWSSLAEMEAAWTKFGADAEAQSLLKQASTFVESERREIYAKLP